MKLVYDDWYDAETLRKNVELKSQGTFSISEVLRCNAERAPESLFINSFGEKMSYGKALGKMNRLVDSLRNLGVNIGDKVAILCGDSDKFVLTYLSIIKAGAATVPLNTRLATAAPEIEYIVNHSESKIWFIEDKFASLLNQIPRERLPNVKEVVVIGEQIPGILSWLELLDGGSETEIDLGLGADNQALQLYTSGTTGRPKGVVITHYNCLAQMDQMSHVSSYTENDRVQNMLPFPHCGFICFCLSAFYAGAGLNIIYPFDPVRCASFAEKEKTSVLVIVPAMALPLMNLPNINDFDFGNIRLLMYGSAPMPYTGVVRMKKLWPWIKLQNIFGMTECAAAITSQKDEDALTKIGGVGRVVPGGRLRVVGEKGEDLPPGKVGEIIYQGPNVMQGYDKDQEANAKALKDGWYWTGDLGTFDEEGVLKVVDRSKDMIIRGGENVYPAEIERVLYEIPAVRECAVVSIPEERMGERVKAFISLKGGQRLKPEEVVKYCKTKLARFKIPEVIEFVDEIPKTPMAKLDKKMLKSLPRDNEWRAWENK